MPRPPSYSGYDPQDVPVFPPSNRFPRRFEDSSIASTLARIEEHLMPPLPGWISRRSSTVMAAYEKQCALIKAWRDLRATVYARVYHRTDDDGKQALQNELDRIMGLVVNKEIWVSYLPPLFGGPSDAHRPTVSDKYRAVLFASDGTVVGLLDELRHIARERPEVRPILPDLPAPCSVWENEQAGCCPFWERMTQDEQWDAVSALKNFVQTLGSDGGVFDSTHERTIPAERIALNRTLQSRAADLLPDIARLAPDHPNAVAHAGLIQQLRAQEEALQRQQHLHDLRRRMDALEYRSLSHRLLDQPLSSRKARIYGMV